MRTQHATIVRMDTHIEFPLAGWSNDVPAGVYYPSVEVSTNRFILMKEQPSGELIPKNDPCQQQWANPHRGENLNPHPYQQGSFNQPARENPQPLSKNRLFLKSLQALINHGSDATNLWQISTPRPQVDYLARGYFPLENYHEGLSNVDKSIRAFLEHGDFYRTQRLDYKRSILLYGRPGMGKSRYLNAVSHRMILDLNAIVLRLESVRELEILLEKGLVLLDRILSDRTKVILIEELAGLVQLRSHTDLLNLLDHPLLRNNVLFLMTTNSPETIPMNIVDRPSRVDLIQGVNVDGLSDAFIPAWYRHLLNEEMPPAWNEHRFYDMKLSPACLKELFLEMVLNGWSLDESLANTELRRAKIAAQFAKGVEIGYN